MFTLLFQYDRFIFFNPESADKFCAEVRTKGCLCTCSSPSGGAYSYGVQVFDRMGDRVTKWPS